MTTGISPAGAGAAPRSASTRDGSPRPGVAGLLRGLSRKPVFYGVTAAVLSAIVGQWWITTPAAYGLCSACHGRDIANWIINTTEGKHLSIAASGTSWPILTVVGVVIGSFLASRRNGEFRSIDLGGNARQFVYGAVVMCAALFVGGCPTRIILRTGYGDLAGVLALGGVALGVVGATVAMRTRAHRQ